MTETLRAKNKECMEFTSQIHILEHSKHRLTSSNNELNSKINLFYENENKNKNNEMEINEIKNTNRHLESTVNMLRETLDTCRSERATLSAKISQLTPAQAASEIEIQKQMNVQISLKQELVALQKETKELTINKITTTNTITEYKRALIVSESTTDEMRIQLIQLRQLKLSLEHKMEENAIASAREIDSIKSKLMNSITKNKDNQTLINNIQSEKYKLQSNNDHIQSNVDAMTVSVTECQNKLLNERSKNQRLLNTQEEIKRTTFQQLEKIQNESLIKERNLNQTKISHQKIKESNFLEINKIKYELEKTNQDKEIMVNKLEEAVRLATTAQRQCLSLEHSTSTLQEKNRQLIQNESTLRMAMETNALRLQEEKKNAFDVIENEKKEKDEIIKVSKYEMNQIKNEAERTTKRLQQTLKASNLKYLESERKVQQFNYEMSNLRESLTKSKMSFTNKETSQMYELNGLKKILNEQKSQLELLSQSHVTLESERNRVALELSDLRAGQHQVLEEINKEKEQTLRDSQYLIASVRQGADDFANSLRMDNSSPGRQRGSTY